MSEEKFVTMTMCHCDDDTEEGYPDPECDDHWEAGVPIEGYEPESGHVFRSHSMTGGFSSRADAQLFCDAKNAKAQRCAK